MVGLTRFLGITPTANRSFGIYSPILTDAPEVTLVALIALPGPSAFLSLAHIARSRVPTPPSYHFRTSLFPVLYLTNFVLS